MCGKGAIRPPIDASCSRAPMAGRCGVRVFELDAYRTGMMLRLAWSASR
jgi:hypothetical protein